MAKAFKKGDKVTFIGDWDRKGTVFFQQATVHSCGNKQMVLTLDSTGAELGRHFRPTRGSLETTHLDQNGYKFIIPAGGTFPRLEGDELQAACLKVAASVIEEQKAHFARCLAGGHGEGYDAAIRRQQDELHEPRMLEH